MGTHLQQTGLAARLLAKLDDQGGAGFGLFGGDVGAEQERLLALDRGSGALAAVLLLELDQVVGVSLQLLGPLAVV